MENSVKNFTNDMLYIDYGDGVFYCTRQEIIFVLIIILLSLVILSIIYTFFISRYFKKKYLLRLNDSNEKNKNSNKHNKFKSYIPYILSGLILFFFLAIGIYSSNIKISPLEFLFNVILTGFSYTIIPLILKFGLNKNYSKGMSILITLLNGIIIHAIFFAITNISSNIPFAWLFVDFFILSNEEKKDDTYQNKTWEQFLEENFKSKGTTTNFSDILQDKYRTNTTTKTDKK